MSACNPSRTQDPFQRRLRCLACVSDVERCKRVMPSTMVYTRTKDFKKPTILQAQKLLSGGTTNENTCRCRVPGQETAGDRRVGSGGSRGRGGPCRDQGDGDFP